MPDAYVHAGGVKAVAISIAAVSVLQFVGANKQWYDAVPMVGGALFGLVVDCDLDIDAGTLAIHQIERAAIPGWLLGHFLALYWKPYALAIHHRSLVSHLPVFSTLLRVLYLIPLSALITYLAQYLAFYLFRFSVWDFAMAHSTLLIRIGLHAVLGLMLADTCHFTLDFAHGQHGKENRDGFQED